MATIEQLLGSARKLDEVSDSANLDTELLLCFCLHKPRSYLRAWPEVDVSDSVIEKFNALLQRRMQGEPVAHLTGERGFWSLDLEVNNSTLIPRPETELLVEIALELLSNSSASILDLGTGTGAIALALASERPQWQLIGCDSQPGAVELAQRNLNRIQLSNARIVQSNWFDQIEPQQFDLIVSNPPYIDAEDPHLQRGDVRHEPRSALVAPDEGLADIKYIIQHAREYLAKGAWLLIEHGYDQGPSVQQLFLMSGFKDVFCKQDLAGVDRVSGGRFDSRYD